MQVLICSCGGGLRGAVQMVAQLKAGFTEDDAYARAEKVIRAAIMQGTMRMRARTEVKASIWICSFRAMQ